MSHEFSRRDFLTGVLVCGAATAAATYLLPGGRRLSQIELNLVTGKDPTGARQLLIDIWNRANPQVTVKLDVVGGQTVDQKSQMAAKARNGAADIVNLDIIDVRDFAANNLITPVELPDADLFLKVIRATLVEGEQSAYWAVPFNTDVGMLFDRGPSDKPTLRQVYDPKLPPQQFVGQLKPISSAYHEAFVVNVLEHALAVDGAILDENGIPAYEPDRWERALTPLGEAVARGGIIRAESEDSTVERFASEPRPRFMRNWPVYYRVLQQKKDPDVAARRVQMHSLPVGILGGQSLALASSGRHAEQATEVIQFLTGDGAQKILAAHGFVPTRTSAYSDENLRTFIPDLEAIRGAVEGARPRPIHRHYGKFPQVIVDHVAPFLDNGTIDMPKFIADMQVALR